MVSTLWPAVMPVVTVITITQADLMRQLVTSISNKCSVANSIEELIQDYRTCTIGVTRPPDLADLILLMISLILPAFDSAIHGILAILVLSKLNFTI
jgi:hypothetical protein